MTLVRPPDLSVRPSGGSAIYSEPVSTLDFTDESVCRIILIHGLRNSENDALEAYESFKSHFSKYASAYSAKVFSFVWPGDHIGINPIRYFDDNTQNSLEAGRVLGAYLRRIARRHDSQCEFIIVAHSLGCRLTAAMLNEVHQFEPHLCKRFRIVLMAGAVPSSDVSNPDVFGAALRAAAYTANLFSESDAVLGRLFFFGELGGGRVSSTAIGLKGAPDDFWSERQPMTGFGHSDYWHKADAAAFVAKLVGANLNAEIPAHEIPVNSLVSHQVA